jgi:hypothetical protein
MCLFVLTSVGLSGSISCAGAENLTSVEITELKQSYQRERMKMFSCAVTNSSQIAAVKNCFDPMCLRSDGEIAIAVTEDKGQPHLEILKENGSESDLFYCSQAIWETAPFFPFDPKSKFFLCEFEKQQSGHAVSEIRPIAPSEKVRLHFIPYSAMRYKVPKEVIFSDENVVQLSKDRIRDPQLEAFRKDWVSFFLAHDTLEISELRAHAQVLRTKYSKLFKQM